MPDEFLGRAVDIVLRSRQACPELFEFAQDRLSRRGDWWISSAACAADENAPEIEAGLQ